MPDSLPRVELARLLDHPNLHEISHRADRLRQALRHREASYAIVDHVDAGGGASWCPICGWDPGQPGQASTGSSFPRTLRDLDPAATDVHLILGEDPLVQVLTSQELRAGWPTPAGRRGWTERATAPVAPTLHLGTASQWITSVDAEGLQDDDLVGPLVEAGVEVLSDGIRPSVHPGLGHEAADRWQDFWRAAAKRGLRGQTVVLYGPDHPVESVLDQIERIAKLQRERSVFLSVAPVIHGRKAYGGVQDGLLTHGQHDLRVLAACRLGLAEVPHVRVAYNRSDLKLAHISLSSGADDLEGHLALAPRSASADADAFDLSVREMPAWLEEAGFVSRVRNGIYELAPAATTDASLRPAQGTEPPEAAEQTGDVDR